MAGCSQYSAAFGYQVYLVPVSACGVDLDAVDGGIKPGGFIDTSLIPLDQKSKIQEGLVPSAILAGDLEENIVYDNDAVLDETVVRLLGLTNAALETDTGSESVTTYDTESRGFDQNIAISKSWSLSLEGMSKFTDAGYKVLRLLEANAVSGQLKCKIGRIGPTGTLEAIYGYATLTGFSESVEAGSIVSWSCTAEGYGPYALDLDNTGSINLVGPVAGFAFDVFGAALVSGTFNDVTLTGGSGTGATANITVVGGAANSVTVADAGDGYKVGDLLTADLAGLGPFGVVSAISVLNGGSAYTDGTYTAVATTTDHSGTGLVVTVVVASGAVTSITPTTGGSGFAVADDVLISAANIGGTGSGLIAGVTGVFDTPFTDVVVRVAAIS